MREKEKKNDRQKMTDQQKHSETHSTFVEVFIFRWYHEMGLHYTHNVCMFWAQQSVKGRERTKPTANISFKP